MNDPNPRPPTVGSRKRILVVEDDPAVSDLMEWMLCRLGYEVHLAGDGPEALRAVRDEGLRPDLLITDLVMPGMGGAELSRAASALCPTLEVLYMSGYTEGAILQRGVLDPGAAYLRKPFDFETLAARVRRSIDGPGG